MYQSLSVLTKVILQSRKRRQDFRRFMKTVAVRFFFTSVKEQAGTEQIRELLKDKTTVVAGPSGVGKSSMINFLYPKAEMMVGEISQKIDRGKHTTRHSELFSIGDNTYLMDTPGFSSLYLTDFEKEDLKEYFAEFRKYEPYCRFQGCMHLSEPDCGVKRSTGRRKDQFYTLRKL